MKRTTAALIVITLAILAAFAAFELPAEAQGASPVNHTVRSLADSGAVNAVSAVLFDYRAFDTLGEATVILMTAMIVAFLAPQARASMLSVRMSSIVLYGVVLLLPFIAVFGLAIMLYGHISPGGGFTGGVVLSTSAVLYAVVYSVGGQQSYVLPPAMNKVIENASMTAFLVVGLVGMAASGAFLANAATGIGLGTPGTLLSAGTIPLLNVISGVKVGAGLGIIIISLFLE